MDILRLKQMLTHFFQEDIGTGDVTSQAIFSDQQCKARIIAKTDGVFAGEAVIREGWKLLHDDIRIRSLKKDGERMKKGDVLAEMEGQAAALLTGGAGHSESHTKNVRHCDNDG